MNRFTMRRIVALLCASGMLSVSSHALASAFQLWEQDGASIANYHAGYAALANDASIAFYNPAGMTRIRNQQLVLGVAAIPTSFKYAGTINVSTLSVPSSTYTVTAQGGTFSLVPNLHFVAPISDIFSFGFSIDVPFGLKTDYGSDSLLRYAATLSSITVIDFSPSLAAQITDSTSFGAGLDVQRAYAQFNQVAGLLTPGLFDTNSTNSANDTGYGYHAGLLYQFSDKTRTGLSYHSQVVHHLTGTSKLNGALTGDVTIKSNNARANVTLPAYTALSTYHRFNKPFALMGSIIYTQWSVFKKLVLQNVAGLTAGLDPITNVVVTIPEHYRNTWNFSLGGDYYATDKITLRGALGYDQTPVRNAYRNVQLPDNNRYVVAFGGHYQASKAFGIDLGWTHLFFNQAKVNPPPQAIGATEVITTNGHVTGGADVFGAQLTWDIV